MVRGERKKDARPENGIILMSTTEVLMGTLRPDGSLELEGKPTLPSRPVRVTVESLSPPKDSVRAVLERIWEERKSGGVTPRSREEIDAGVEAGRLEWDERDRDIERLREGIRRAEEDPSEGGPLPSLNRPTV